MIKNKKAESLVWIIIAVFILSFTMLWILNIFGFNKWIEANYKDNIYAHIIKWNSENLIKKLNIPEMDNNEFFYIKKDTTNKTFTILTGSTNDEYQYIDYLWNKVNPNNNPWKTYKRIFQFKADILRHVIYPNEIPNLSFWYDATNVDWNNNIWLNDGDEISTLKDLSWNWNDAKQNTSWKKPKLKKVWIKDKDALQFDWSNDRLLINDNELINTNNDSNKWVNWIIYSQRSLAVVLKTWDDVTSDQMIYEEWWTRRWYSYMIHNWDIYAWIWNNNERDNGHKYKSVNLWEALPDTVYFITIVQDSSHWEYAWDGTTNNNFDDNANRLKIYLNWKLAAEAEHVDPQVEHPLDNWIWALTQWTVLPRSPYNSDSWDNKYFFKWYLWELIEWNHALSETEVRWLQNYFEQKWYDRIDNVKYNIVKTSSYKVVE
jgi:hypothetical protein